ncbi:hypothetical protein P6166_00315 [Stenotrophomonas sp. HITSZ_GD]|uniref:hypothetical protein n=1 Tax=Stenotrophomonas sp. HITSZ_GD TaxID=3037248 RepID=UPI00240E5113|nr:hypothetical protein [Stenotrophomonas sp. HITSZ_GD]MDG2523803.1 hypothetical protein [Stenotrophomonas sp. HITSZ_GD]
MKWEKGDGGGKNPLRIADFAAYALDATPDAALWEMDTAGSQIPYPATGTVSVMLMRSADNVVVAAQTFSYVKSGTIVRLADPDAVNNWAYANAGDADSIKYETAPFVSMFQGEKTTSIAAKYASEQQASFSATVYGNPRCTTYPSPYQCQPE